MVKITYGIFLIFLMKLQQNKDLKLIENFFGRSFILLWMLINTYLVLHSVMARRDQILQMPVTKIVESNFDFPMNGVKQGFQDDCSSWQGKGRSSNIHCLKYARMRVFTDPYFPVRTESMILLKQVFYHILCSDKMNPSLGLNLNLKVKFCGFFHSRNLEIKREFNFANGLLSYFWQILQMENSRMETFFLIKRKSTKINTVGIKH